MRVRCLVFFLLLLGLVAPVWGITRSSMIQEFEQHYYPLTTTTTTCTDVALAAAITAMQALTPPRTVLVLSPVDGAGVACTWTLAADVTVPRTITLRIPHGAVVSVSSGKTLTVNGPVVADDPGWYSGAGTVTLNYREPTVDGLNSYVVSGCAPTVPVSSLTLAAFACRANLTSEGQWYHMHQTAATVGPLSGGNGTYWLALHRDTTSTISGWTRQSGTAYVWKLSSAQPTLCTGCVLVSKIVVALSIISTITDLRPMAPSLPVGWIDATKYGVDCDGTTNMASQIQAALNATPANVVAPVVFIPPQRAACILGTTTLTLPRALSLKGGGMGSTTLTYTGSGAALESATKATTRLFNGVIEDLTIQGSGKVAGSVGIDMAGLDAWRLYRVESKTFDTGIKLNGGTGVVVGGYRNTLQDMLITGNNTGVQLVGAANEQLLLGNKITSNTNYGVDIQDANSLTLLHNDLESNGKHVRTASPFTRVLGGRMEGATTYAWETTATAQYFLIENVARFSGAGQAYLDNGAFTTIRDRSRDAVRGRNLLVNGGLEAWWQASSSTVNRATGWTVLSSATGTRDTDAQEGSYSALLTAASTSSAFYQDYAIPAAHRQERLREYLLLAWVKLGTSTSARVRVVPQDGAGTTDGIMLGPTLVTTAGATVTTAGWQLVWLTVWPGATAVRLRVLLEPDRALGSGTTYFDAVTLLEMHGPDREFYDRGGDQLSLVNQYLYSVSSYNPPSLIQGEWDATDITLVGVAPGDLCLCTHEQVTTEQMVVTCNPTVADTVRVKFWNQNGVDLNIAPGFLHVGCWKRRGS